ncbi:MAG TPA: hypothetical protein VKK79_02430, partial [Candidatus Lokiarchaeia archaeon]|nr:hypothetical protein [Candidatus Lokiarchaeia archaeon]
MNLQNWRKKAFLFGIFGNIQDIIISTIAMFFYAGGTSTDPTTRGYSFWLNMFSDLGRTVTYSGVPNTISNILLAVYACIWGISTGVLFIALPPLFAESCKGRWTSCLAVLFALIGASTLAGVTFVPEDVYPIIHGDLAS